MRRLLPKLVAVLTRWPRQVIVPGEDFQWSSNSWTHNIFRLGEVLFGRKYGPNGIGDTIRAEGTVAYSDGQTFVVSHSFENRVAVVETVVRQFLSTFRLPKFSFVKLYVPQLAPIGYNVQRHYVWAVAYDNSNSSEGGTNSTSISLTITGANILVAIGSFDINTTVGNISATVAGSSATIVGSNHQKSTDNNQMSLLYYVGASAGSNTIVTNSANSGGLLDNIASSYSGCNQTGQPDNSTTTLDDAITSKTVSVTVNTANSWLIMIGRWQAGAGTVTASTGVRRQDLGLALLDSNAAVGTGSQSISVSRSPASASGLGTVIMSVAPVSVPTAKSVTSDVVIFN